jgi:hypothetical protein
MQKKCWQFDTTGILPCRKMGKAEKKAFKTHSEFVKTPKNLPKPPISGKSDGCRRLKKAILLSKLAVKTRLIRHREGSFSKIVF